jgi:8-oxo-dGTP pyrophosphatase MutT (NUDIX family)
LGNGGPQPGAQDNPVPRLAGRVLLLDAGDRVLLVRGSDPGRPGSRYWFTLGGGVDDGESIAQGAARELFEETGLRVRSDDLGEPVFEDVTEFPYEGTWYRQANVFFLLRVPAWHVPVDQIDPAEEHYIHEHRWWSLSELVATDETVYPPDLLVILRSILGGNGEGGQGNVEG